MKKRGASKGRRWLKRFFAVLAAVTALLIYLDWQLRPVIERMAAYQVRIFAARTVNDAILVELDGTVQYDDIVVVYQNQDGNVTSIQTNMMEVNRLKANVTRAVIEDLESLGMSTVRIPLGTLLGSEYTAGRGPRVEFRVYPTGYVQTEIYSQFTSAGINQTLHQVMLRTTVQMTAIIPGYNITTQTDTNFCIAQTVIVGDIPEAYTQINQDEAPLISKVNDYAAEAAR